MKKIVKSTWGIFLAILLLVTAIPVQAAQFKVYVPKTLNVVRYSAKDKTPFGSGDIKNQTWLVSLPGKATNLKSSRSSVATITQKKVKKTGAYEIWVNAKKAGKATVSFKYKSKTYKVKVTVTKYRNPVSSIQIGNTKLSSAKFNTSSVYTMKYSKFANKKVKINIKLKRGWQLVPTINRGKLVQGFYYYRKGWLKSSSNIRNGSKITIKGGKGFCIGFLIRNKSTGQQERIDIILK